MRNFRQIGLYVTGATPGWNSMLAQLGSGSEAGGSQADAVKRGIGVPAGVVQREANVQAYIDGFWVAFLAAIVGLFVVALMTRSPAHPLTK